MLLSSVPGRPCSKQWPSPGQPVPAPVSGADGQTPADSCALPTPAALLHSHPWPLQGALWQSWWGHQRPASGRGLSPTEAMRMGEGRHKGQCREERAR